MVLPAAAKARRLGLLGRDEVCAAVLTGFALRDPLPGLPRPPRVTAAEADALLP